MMTPDDVLRLMEGMSKNGIHSMEFDGLKLGRAVERQVPISPPSATNISVSPNAPPPAATAEAAWKAVQAARMAAAANAEMKLSAAQTRTARARRKAAGGIGVPGSKLVEDIYQKAVATPVPPAASVLDSPKQD